ncbi:MAG: DUF3035 domain-containing protein [Thalassovita sp.]|nr:DUF3035 domain-containing protein [Thalassovita sp.]
MPRALLVIAVLALAACSGSERDIRMRDLRSFTGGPDEFSILPSKELQSPENYASLPVPTPGGSNLTDQNPLGDGIAALGGKPGALVPGRGVPAADSALLAFVGRNGVPADIRETLAAEDLAFRTRASRFTRFKIVREDLYNDTYRRQTIDPHAELWRWRRFGVTTPSAPPVK